MIYRHTRGCPVCGGRFASLRTRMDELTQMLERVGVDDPPPPEPPTSFTSLLADFFRT